MTNDYTKDHIIEFPEGSGKRYIFNPTLFGRGLWAELTINNKAGKIVPAYLQKQLNEYFFGLKELPNMYERFSQASKEEKESLKRVSIGWMQLKIKALKSGSPFPNGEKGRPFIFSPGGMYLFVYDAKTKNKLPIWDKLPLIILLDINSNENIQEQHFLGINLHFLDVPIRTAFISELESNSVYDKTNNFLKTNKTYQQLKSTGFFTKNSNCIKYYLSHHIQTKILPIEPHEWGFASQFTFGEFVKKRK